MPQARAAKGKTLLPRARTEFSHLPNSVKDKAEFCFQKCFHISRSDFRFISSSSIWPHIAPKDAFFMFLSYHVFVILQPSFRIFLQIYTFASSQTFRQTPLFLSYFPKAICVTLPPMFRQAPLFLFSVTTSDLRGIAPRCSGKRRFLGKKALKDVTRRTGLLAQHIFPDASLFFLFCSPIKQKPHYLMLQISKNYTGNSSIIFDNSGFSGVNAGSHYIFLPKSYENGNFVCFGISLPSFAVKFLARSALSRA